MDSAQRLAALLELNRWLRQNSCPEPLFPSWPLPISNDDLLVFQDSGTDSDPDSDTDSDTESDSG